MTAERRTGWLLPVAAVAACALTASRAVVEATTRTRLLLDHPSGTWATLADDLLHGTFYRPVSSALGWGGTRYPPLHPMLRAGLARLGLGLPAAGTVLECVALVALVLAVRRLLVRSGAPPELARCAAALVLLLVPVQQLLGLGKADLVATAFSAWAVARAAGPGRRGGDAVVGALGAAAILAKWTVVFGLAAAVHDAWAAGRRRAALVRAGVAAGLVGAGVGLATWASDGRMLAQLRATGGGGGGAGGFLTAPFDFLLHADAGDLALLLLAGAALAGAREAGARHVPPLLVRWLGWSLLGTVLVFASPGIGENHLLDVDVAALAVVAAGVASSALPWRAGTAALAGLALLLVTRTATESVEGLQNLRPAALVALLGSPADGPLLAENPWVPLLAGERPLVMDPFAFRIVAARDPSVGAALAADLRARRFRAVVLRRPVEGPVGEAWYRDTHFGAGFVEALEAGYERAASHPTLPRPLWTHDVWTRRRTP